MRKIFRLGLMAFVAMSVIATPAEAQKTAQKKAAFQEKVLSKQLPAGSKIKPIGNNNGKNNNGNNNSSSNNNASNNTNSGNDDQRRQALRDVIASFESKDQIENVVLNTKSSPKYLVMPNGKAMLLQITKKDINESVQNIMPIDETNIYPGCIVYANGELMAGKPQEVDFGVKNQLGTVTVYVNFNNGKETAKHNVKAEASSIRTAISEILNAANGNTPPAQIQKQHNQYTSVSKIAVDLGCSVEYLESNCNINTSTSVGSETMYDMQSFNQAFYTVTIEPEDKDKTNFFGTGVTADVYKKIANNKGPIAIIKSVTYGRSGFYKKEYSASDFSFTGEESGSYNGVGVTSKQDITKNTKSTTEFGRVIGGSATTAGNALSEEKFLDIMLQNCEVSGSNQGVPIYYTVQFISSGKQCIQKQTGNYEEISYVPLRKSFDLYINQQAEPLRGTTSVQLNWKFKVINIPGTGDVATEKGEVTGSHDFSSKTSWSTNVKAGADTDYILDNSVEFTTKSRKAATKPLNKWEQNHQKSCNIPGNGKVNVKLTGYYLKKSVDMTFE